MNSIKEKENRLVSVKEIDNSWVKISRLEFRSKEEQEEEMRKKWHIKHGDLNLEKDMTFRESLIVRGNITGPYNLKVEGNLTAENINVLDLDTYNINAYNIDAFDISACNITAHNIDAYSIDVHNIDAHNINAHDIDAYDISGWNINIFYILCNTIHQREGDKLFTLSIFKGRGKKEK